MQAVIYAGLRNPARDHEIHEALQCKHVKEVAEEYKCTPSAIRKAAKRIESATVFELSLLGGTTPLRIGAVAADCFRKAALGAYRHYHGTFRSLELPCWKITDGENTIELMELRKIDTGEASI